MSKSSEEKMERRRRADYPCDIRVRLTEDLRTRLVLCTSQKGTSLSETVREALELKFALDLQQ